MNKYRQYYELFSVFFKIGAFTFGGGYAMISLIRNEVTQKRKWLDDEEFMDMLAIAQSLPGPISLNTALFVGDKRKGFKGSLFAGAGIIVPSFVVILLIALVFAQFKDNLVVKKVFLGIRPAVVALIAAPLFSLGKAANLNWQNLWIPVLVAVLVWKFSVSPVFIVLGTVMLGIAWFILSKRNPNQ